MDYADSSSSQTSPEEIKLFEAVLSPESPDQQCSSTTFLNSERHHRLQSAVSLNLYIFLEKIVEIIELIFYYF